MIKKLSLLSMILMGTSYASSCTDVVSRVYAGVDLGYVSGNAPILSSQRFYNQLRNSFLDPIETEGLAFVSKEFTKTQLRGLAVGLALGGQFLIPRGGGVVLGAELSCGVKGPKGRSILEAISLDYGDDVGPVFFGSSNGDYSLIRTLHDRGNITFAGTIGAKMGSVLPYIKVGLGIHEFKWTEQYISNQIVRNHDTATTTTYTYPYVQQKKVLRALFVVGLGLDVNLTQNILVGAQWTHRRGTSGVYKTADTGRQYYYAFKTPNVRDLGKGPESNKVYMNEFMATLKYAFPVEGF